MSGERCDLCRHGFLALLAHELRNPLAAMSNSLYVLTRCRTSEARGGDEARAARALWLIERQVRHMAALIDNLTEAAKLGGDAMSLHPTEVDLATLVRDACCDLEHLFLARDIELRLEIPAGVLPMRVDAARVTQVLGNLLHNAAQFTPSGGQVVVGLALDEAGKRVQLSVRDTGIGLDAEQRDRLFQPFAHAVRSLARGGGGLGLGLALVKGIVELHGGSVRADSAGPGQGSSFVVELPWPATVRPAAPAIAASSA